MVKSKELSYPYIKQVIDRTDDLRTKAMIAIQYALGCRCGELLSYTHTDGSESPGLLKSNIVFNPNRRIYICKIPNFKTTKQVWKKPFIQPREYFLYKPFKDWFDICGEQVFPLRVSRYRQLVDAALPEGYSTHCLRHSRATHLAELFDFSAFQIKAFLGHARLDTSAIYVSQDLSRTASKMEATLIRMNA